MPPFLMGAPLSGAQAGGGVANGPRVDLVTADGGPDGGGTSVTVTGEFFTGATSCTFDGITLDNIVVVDDFTITGDTPAHWVGFVDVSVTTPVGTGTLTDGYRYAALFDFDFTTLALGAHTAASFLTATAVDNPAGLVFTRDTISTVQTSDTTLDKTPGINEACIGNRTAILSKRGLVLQGLTFQRFGDAAVPNNSPNNIQTTGAGRWTPGTAGSTAVYDAMLESTTLNVPAVGGGAPAGGGYSNYATILSSTAPTCFSFWGDATRAKVSDGTTAVFAVQQGSKGVIRKGSLIATTFVFIEDRTFYGFTGSGYGPRVFHHAQYEHGDFPTESISTGQTARRSDRLSYATGSDLIATNGQIKFFARFAPKFASTQQVNYSASSTALWQDGFHLFSWGAVLATPANYAFIKDSDKKLRVKLAGGSEYTSTNAMSWSQYDDVEVFVALGNNVASVAKYRVNGGAWIDLVLATIADVPAPSTAAIHFFINSVVTHASGASDTGALVCWLHRLTIPDGAAPAGA